MTFAELFTDHVAAAFDRQLGLADQIGDWAWSFDLQQGSISFTKKQLLSTKARASAAQVLGTESHGAGTWLWGWANQRSNIPPALLASAVELRQLGEREGIAELAEPETALGAVDGHALALVASGVLGKPGYYRGPYDGGALFVLLEDEAFRPVVERPALRITTVFPQVLQSFAIADHRRAFFGHLRAYGLQTSAEAERVSARDQHTGDTLVGRFEGGRLAGIDLRAG